MIKNKTLQTLGIIGLAVMIAATIGLLQQQLQQQPQQFAYASIDPETGNNINEEEEAEIEAEEEGGGMEGGSESSSSSSDCSRTQASDPELQGWTIETCGNGDQTWISPKGTRCVGNEASEVLACDDMNVMKGLQGDFQK
jgi:hypothetical protein